MRNAWPFFLSAVMALVVLPLGCEGQSARSGEIAGRAGATPGGASATNGGGTAESGAGSVARAGAGAAGGPGAVAGEGGASRGGDGGAAGDVGAPPGGAAGNAPGGSAGTGPDPAIVASAGPKLAVGWHACAIHGTALECWGNNSNDQLGYSGADATMPVTLPGAWVAVAVGSEFTCGIKSDLSLWCWGITLSGCLGIGPTSEARISLPTNVGDGYLRIAATGLNACAIKTDQTLWCWGDKDWGLLGTCGNPGETACNDPDSLAPIQVGTGFVDLDMGSGRAAALHETALGTVLWTWGGGADFWQAIPAPSGSEGALATQVSTTNDGWIFRDGGTVYRMDYPSPPAVDAEAPFPAIDVSGGITTTCAINEAGEIWCRGSNVVGELGDGNWFGGNPYTNLQPWTRIGAAQATWTDVDVGARTACARDFEDVVWCWGENAQGQLGDGTTTNRSIPSPVGQAPPAESCFDGVASGGELRTDCGGPGCIACP